MKFAKIALKKGNRMLRVGFGQHDGIWFFRVDFWSVAVRISRPS